MKQNQRINEEYTAFEGILRQVIQVPHSEIKAKLDAEKKQKKESPKKDRKRELDR